MEKNILIDLNLNNNTLSNVSIQSGTSKEYPKNPKKGCIFFNTTLDCLVIYNGANWVNVSKNQVVLDLLKDYLPQLKTLSTEGTESGKIVQYSGETTDTLTNGYFYKFDGTNWNRINVQPEIDWEVID